MSLPLTVIGGYLGAGKTSLLNRMLTGDNGRRIAVIVNDFGALNVDASLVVSHAGDTIALSNGCICCSASDGTGTAIAQILARKDAFGHIVIEASGVAEPGKVARNAAAFRLPLDGVIVLADAEQLPDQVANRYTGRSVIAQLRQADLVVINKTDLADADRLAETRAVVERHAPGATIVTTDHARLPLSVLFGARPSDAAAEAPEGEKQAAHHAGTYRAGLSGQGSRRPDRRAGGPAPLSAGRAALDAGRGWWMRGGRTPYAHRDDRHKDDDPSGVSRGTGVQPMAHGSTRFPRCRPPSQLLRKSAFRPSRRISPRRSKRPVPARCEGARRAYRW
jgi:G3E family GTPase